jgi:hypothetical protein
MGVEMDYMREQSERDRLSEVWSRVEHSSARGRDGDAGGIYAQALLDLLNRVEKLEEELRSARHATDPR